MAFSTNCSNKGCFKFVEPILDVDTNEAMCPECDKPISNITDFVKRQLKDDKKIKKAPKVQKAFSTPCRACKAVDVPELKKGKLWCSHCGNDLECTAAFIQMFKSKNNLP